MANRSGGCKIDRIVRERELDDFDQRLLEVQRIDAAFSTCWTMRTSNASGSKGSSESATHCRRPASSYTSFARARAASASEDTVDSLSESEREVNGLVIDAVEMLEADRIRGLLDYFEDHTEYVVAVLPEESRELEETYPTVSTASFAARS